MTHRNQLPSAWPDLRLCAPLAAVTVLAGCALLWVSFRRASPQSSSSTVKDFGYQALPSDLRPVAQPHEVTARRPFVQPRLAAMPLIQLADLLPQLPRRDEASALLADQNGRLDERQRAALALATECTADALRELRSALATASATLKAAIAATLGVCMHADAWTLLLELLEDSDPLVARGALRGLGELGSPEAVEILTSVLQDADEDPELRQEAALALGRVRSPAALQALALAMEGTTEVPLRAALLEALGTRPVAETWAFFETYLASPETSAAEKALAIEALAAAEGDAAKLVLPYAADPYPQVRESVASVLADAEEPGLHAAGLLEWLAREQDPAVRMRIYEALANQQDVDAAAVLFHVQAEADPDGRLAGWALVAAASRGQDTSTSAAARAFEADALPELTETALNDADSHRRLSALIALRRSSSLAARKAIQRIEEKLGATAGPRAQLIELPDFDG